MARIAAMFLKIGCFLGAHSGQRQAFGSFMSGFGPRYLYQCKSCRRYFSEPWQ